MLESIKEFWKSLEPKIIKSIAENTRNCIRRERYDVTTPPDGEKIGVKPPYGTEIFLPYSPAVANAQQNQTVLVEWRGSLSTGVAVAFADGIINGATIVVPVTTAWSGSGPYTQTVTAPGMSPEYVPTPSLVMPESGQLEAMAAYKSIVAVVAGTNNVTIFADTATTTNIYITLKL